MNIMCMIGKHKRQLVAVDNDYRVEWAEGKYRSHTCWFYKCEHCGKRTFDTTFKHYDIFPAMLAAKKNWEISGMIHDRARLPSDYHEPTRKTAEVIPFRVIQNEDPK